MNQTIADIEIIAAKVLSGEANAEEMAALENWTAASPENRQYVEALTRVFYAAQLGNTTSFDPEAAWTRVKPRLDKKVIPLRRNPSKIYWSVAAAITLLATISYLLFAPAKITETNLVATTQIVRDTLPDGNFVHLNKNTTLATSWNPKKKTTRVKLTGEAYFEIPEGKTAAGNEFIVDAGGVIIRDIGTKFNVRAYPDSDQVDVVVEVGEVIISAPSLADVTIKAPGSGVYHRKTGQFEARTPELNATAYHSRRFVFENTPLGEAIAELNSVYNTAITLNPVLARCPVTVTFDQEDPEMIVTILAETFGLTVTRSNNTFHLDGPACEIP